MDAATAAAAHSRYPCRASAYGAAELAGFGLDACNIGKPVEPQRLLGALEDIARGSATEG